MRKSVVAGAALALAALVGAAVAQEPPANIRDEAAIKTWRTAAKINDATKSPAVNWALLGVIDQGMLMTAVQTRELPEEKAKIGIRMERFRPNGRVMSETTLYDIDCDAKTMRATRNSLFAEHNLEGARQDLPPGQAWVPVSSNPVVAALVGAACVAPLPDYRNEKVMLEWMRQNGISQDNSEGREWLLVGFRPEGVILSRRFLDTRRSSGRSAVVTMRVERFAPVRHPTVGVVLSESTDFEINCTTESIRIVQQGFYEHRNLLGKRLIEPVVQDWSPVSGNALLKSTAQDICTALEVRPISRTTIPPEDAP